MFTSQLFRYFTSYIIIAILFLQINCICIVSQSLNTSFAGGFSAGVATWYDSATGAGSGAACGFENDVAYPPYNSMTAAGNKNIFQSGKGCGACYQVKCTTKTNSLCSGNPVTVTVTNECPGACNNEAFHFDLSGLAFGALSKPGQADAMRKLGRIDIQYQRVLCEYSNTGIQFKIDKGSNINYLAFAIEFVNGDGDIGSVEISSKNSNGWLSMKQSWGATWSVGLPVGISGPYSVKITTIESKKTALAYNVIPANWSPQQNYRSKVNVS